MDDPELLSDARRWLRYAREDMVSAAWILGESDIAPRESCWLAQQAAEKA